MRLVPDRPRGIIPGNTGIVPAIDDIGVSGIDSEGDGKDDRRKRHDKKFAFYWFQAQDPILHCNQLEGKLDSLAKTSSSFLR